MALSLSRKEALPLVLGIPLAACAETSRNAQPTPLATTPLAKEPEQPKELEKPLERGWFRYHSPNGFYIDYPSHWSLEIYEGGPDVITGLTNRKNKFEILIYANPLKHTTFESYMLDQLEQEQAIRGVRWSKEAYERSVQSRWEDVMKYGPPINGKKIPFFSISRGVTEGRLVTEAAFLLSGESWHIEYAGPVWDDDEKIDEGVINLYSQKVVPSFRFDEQFQSGQKTPLPLR